MTLVVTGARMSRSLVTATKKGTHPTCGLIDFRMVPFLVATSRGCAGGRNHCLWPRGLVGALRSQ